MDRPAGDPAEERGEALAPSRELDRHLDRDADMRRWRDAAMVAPFVGTIALCPPFVWIASGPGAGLQSILYVFGVWALLILGTALLMRRLGAAERGGRPQGR